MAYVTPQDNALDENGVALDAPVRLATQAPSAVGTTLDGTTTEQATPKASSGTFTNLSSYLNANQGGAQNLGTQVGNKISEDVKAADTAVTGANDAFRSQIAANTNTATPDYIANVVAAPKDYLNDTTFAKDLSGTYGGPTSFLGTADAQKALGTVQNAQQTAKLAGTEGGRTHLINQVSEAPLTRGGANLDQWLVQGNAPAFSTVQNAAASANPLQTRYDTAVSEGDKAAKEAAKGNQDLRSQILQSLSTGQSAYTNKLQTQATDTAAKMNANNTAVAQFLKSGGKVGDTGVILPQLGMTPQAFAALQAANESAQAKGLPGVDLSSFWTGTQSPNFDVGNVASEGDIANLNAYAKFLGNANPVINRGAVTPGAFDFVNAGQRIADMIKTNSATGGSNSTPVTNKPAVGSNTVGGYVSNANTGGGSSHAMDGSSADATTGGSSSGGKYDPGYTVGDDGIAHMNSTGLTDGQAKALGVLAGMLTGIPALGTLGQYVNNSINERNFAAAQQFNNAESLAYAKEAQAQLGPYGGYTTGSDMNVGSQAYTDAQRAAQNNVVKTPDQITSESSPTANYAAQAEAQAKLNAALAAAQAQDQAQQDPLGSFIAQQEAAAAQRQAEAEAQAQVAQQAAAEAAQRQAEAQAAQQAAAAAAQAAQAAQDARGYSSSGAGYTDGSENRGWSSSGDNSGSWGSYSGGGSYGGYTTGSNSSDSGSDGGSDGGDGDGGGGGDG